MTRLLTISMLLICALLFAGCEDMFEKAEADTENTTPESEAEQEQDSGVVSTTTVPTNFAGVVWLHANVSSWAETATLNTSVSGGMVHLDYNKSRSWPSRSAGGTTVNANPWIFVLRDGVWYAGTWEWLRPGQTAKSTSSVNGSHIKVSPLNNFSPRSGETYGFMVSGLARDDTRNVSERSNVCMVQWP